MIGYNNYEYTVEQTSKICFQKNSFNVDRLGNGIAIKSRKYNFTVLYTSEGDIKIGVSFSFILNKLMWYVSMILRGYKSVSLGP